MGLMSKWSDAEDRAYETSNNAAARAARTGDPADERLADDAAEHHARVFDSYNAEVVRRWKR